MAPQSVVPYVMIIYPHAPPNPFSHLQTSMELSGKEAAWGLQKGKACGAGEPGYLYLSKPLGNLLQCSCLENPRDGGAWWAAVYGVTQSQTQLK